MEVRLQSSTQRNDSFTVCNEIHQLAFQQNESVNWTKKKNTRGNIHKHNMDTTTSEYQVANTVSSWRRITEWKNYWKKVEPKMHFEAGKRPKFWRRAARCASLIIHDKRKLNTVFAL